MGLLLSSAVMLCTKETVFPVHHRAQPLFGISDTGSVSLGSARLVDWPWVLCWLGNRKSELLCKNWEGSQQLRDLHPLPFHTCSSSIFLSPGGSRSTWGSSRYPSIAGMQLGS